MSGCGINCNGGRIWEHPDGSVNYSCCQDEEGQAAERRTRTGSKRIAQRKAKTEAALRAAGWRRAEADYTGSRYDVWRHPKATASARLYLGPLGSLRYQDDAMWSRRAPRPEDGAAVTAVLAGLEK